MRSVVILLDTLRRDMLSCYGNDWAHTPNIDRLAERSVIFDNHYVGSLPCMPARRDMHTGRLNFLHTNWCGIQPFDDSICGSLREAGVHSHLATDHYHYFHAGGENYHDQFDSWDFQRGQERDKWVGLVDKVALPETPYPTKLNPITMANRRRQRHEEEYSGPRTVMDAIRWLDENHASDDWFLQLECFDPHEPFVMPDEYLRLYGDDYDGPPWDWPAYEQLPDLPKEAADHMRRRYAALLTMTDRWVGRFLDTLEQHGIFDDTMIVLTTDHGTLLGERGGYWMKNYMPVFQNLARIPLLVHLPGGEGAGEHCPALTQTPDIARTLCQFHGAEAPEHCMGISFIDSYRGTQRHEAILYGYFGMAVNVTDGEYLYYRNPVDDDAELYAYTCFGDVRRFKSPSANARVGFRAEGFDFTKQLGLYRVPAKPRTQKLFEEAGGAGRHQLFRVGAGFEQVPIEDDAVEARLVGEMKRMMQALDAPAEQYQRIGLA